VKPLIGLAVLPLCLVPENLPGDHPQTRPLRLESQKCCSLITLLSYLLEDEYLTSPDQASLHRDAQVIDPEIGSVARFTNMHSLVLSPQADKLLSDCALPGRTLFREPTERTARPRIRRGNRVRILLVDCFAQVAENRKVRIAYRHMSTLAPCPSYCTGSPASIGSKLTHDCEIDKDDKQKGSILIALPGAFTLLRRAPRHGKGVRCVVKNQRVPSREEYLMDATLSEVSYDGTPHRVTRFCGPGKSWQVFLISKRGAKAPDGSGTCMIDDILSHWNDLTEYDRHKLQAIVEDLCPAGSYERRKLAERVGSGGG
jgi:hypothetical protein